MQLGQPELASATTENALSEQNWRWRRSECAFTRRAAGSSSGWGCGMSAQSALDGSGLLFQRDTCRERLGEVVGWFIYSEESTGADHQGKST